MFFAVLTGAPLCVLPAKDTVEELFWKKTGMSKRTNALVTFAVVFACYLISILLTNIGDALTIMGSTTNPIVTFILTYTIIDWFHNPDHILLESQERHKYLVKREDCFNGLRYYHHSGISAGTI